MSTLAKLLPALERLVTAEAATATWADQLRGYLDTELDGLADIDWLTIRALAKEALILDDHPLDTQLPILRQLEAAPLALAALSTRLRNILLRDGLTTWEQLGSLTPTQILDRRNAGRGTLNEVLGYALDVARRTTVGSITAMQVDVSWPVASQFEMPPAPVTSRHDLQLVATWAVRTTGAQSLSDVVNPKAPLQALFGIPAEVRAAWERLGELPLTAFANAELLGVTVDELLEQLASSLSDTERHIVNERLLRLQDMPTLDELGKGLGVTRERVRQIQTKARTKLEVRVSSPSFSPLHWAVQKLRATLGAFASIEEPSTLAAIARELERDVTLEDQSVRWLLLLAGPYEQRGSWLLRSDATPPSPQLLEHHADEFGVIDVPSLEAELTELPMTAANASRWIRDCGLVHRMNDRLVLWRGSVADKAFVVLAARREPADAETIVDMIGEGHSVRGTRNRLFDDDRFVRVSKSDWGLRIWGLEEYTGIADELRQRIEERGGAAPLDELVNEIAQTFGVRETSVRTYASAPMFVLDGSEVRLRGPDEPYPVGTDIRDVRGCYADAGSLIVTITVDRDVLRGSGQLCPPSVAGRLGVTPGHARAFQHPSGRLAVTWVESAALGPSLGSTRALAESTEAEAGDQLLLTFDLNESTVAARKILRPSGVSALESAMDLCGLPLSELDPGATLARGLGVPASDVRAALTRRGDQELAKFLPPPAKDDDLDAALAEFGSLLTQLEA